MLSGILSTLKPGNLAKLATPRAPAFKGLLPTFETLCTLLLVSLAITGGLWLWTGAVASVVAFLPVYLKTLAVISGAALLNFFVCRDVNTAMLSCRPNRVDNKTDEYERYDVDELVEELRSQLNAHFREVYGEAHVDLPKPRICLYTSNDPKVQVVSGMTLDDTGLFISDAFFRSSNTHWNMDHLKSLIANRLVQAYHRRGWGSTLVSIISNFLFTLESLQDSEFPPLRVLGLLSGPLQFFFFVQNAIERSYAYEASTHVKNMHRGINYFDAIDIKVFPTLVKQNSYNYLQFDQVRKKRAPYSGPFQDWLRPVTNWIDDLELADDNKNCYRLTSLVRSIAREITGFFFKELNSRDPRTTNIKNHLRTLFNLDAMYSQYVLANGAGSSLNDFIATLVRFEIIDNVAQNSFYARFNQKINKEGVQLTQEQIAGSLSQLPEIALNEAMRILSDDVMATLGRKDKRELREFYNRMRVVQSDLSVNQLFESLVEQQIIGRDVQRTFHETFNQRLRSEGIQLTLEQMNGPLRNLPENARGVALNQVVRILTDHEMAVRGSANKAELKAFYKKMRAVGTPLFEYRPWAGDKPKYPFGRNQAFVDGLLARIAALEANQQQNVAPQPAAPAAVPPFVPQQQQQAAASPRTKDYDSGNDSDNDGQTERNRREFGK